MKRKTTEEFEKEVYNITKDYIVLGEYIDAKTKIKIKHNCEDCHNYEYYVTPNNFLNGKRCPKCYGDVNRTPEEFLQIVYSMVGNSYTIMGLYKNSTTKIKMRHNCTDCNNHEYYVTPNSFLQGRRCPVCYGNIKKTKDEFEKEVLAVCDEYTIIGEYINAHSKIEVKHNKCDHSFKITPMNFLNRNCRCLYCNNNHSVLLEDFNDIYTTNKKLFALLKDPEMGHKYKEHSEVKLDWVCPNCGNIIKNKSICVVNKNGLSCTRCGDGISYPEKIMTSVLAQLGVDFETQKSFDWCKYTYKNKLRNGYYDFYFKLNGFDYVVETDGGWHSNDNVLSGQTREESEDIDIQKDTLADEYGVDVIRIKSDQSEIAYIKKFIYESRLKNLFDLSNIDWDQCDKYALSSNVIIVCKLFNEHKTMEEIRNITHLSRGTIWKYLKRGTTHKFCNYNGLEAMKNNIKNAYNKTKIPIKCIETHEIFESIKAASLFYSAPSIWANLHNKCKSAGTLPDGTLLHWQYEN